MEHIIVFITAPSVEDAENIGNELVDSRLAACANIVPGIRSIFIWNDKKESVDECLLLVKTQKTHFNKIRDKVRQLHAYDTPEIISVQISDGNQDYLGWIDKAVSGSKD